MADSENINETDTDSDTEKPPLSGLLFWVITILAIALIVYLVAGAAYSGVATVVLAGHLLRGGA